MTITSSSYNELPVRNIIDECGGKICEKLRKDLESGKVGYKEKYIIEELLRIIRMDSENEETKEINKDILKSEALEKLEQDKNLEPYLKEQKENLQKQLPEDFKNLFDKNNKETAKNLWLKYGIFMLVFILYTNGISSEILGKWMGVNKTTICRWMDLFSEASKTIMKENVVLKQFSGIINIDEKWIKINKKWYYWCMALDGKTGLPIHYELLPSTKALYIEQFLIKIKNMGYNPYVIVTDCLSSYRKAIPKVFKNAKHQLCIFHILMNGFRLIKKQKKELDNPKTVVKGRAK